VAVTLDEFGDVASAEELACTAEQLQAFVGRFRLAA